MNKKICMFVWNNFTTDARVLRECTTLSEAGYDVKLICIQYPKELPEEEIINGFKVRRVKRYPNTYYKFKDIKKSIKSFRSKLVENKILLLLLLPVLILLLPILILGLIIFKILKKTGILKAYYRFGIFLRMIMEGLKFDADIYHSNDLNTLPQGYICKKIKGKKLVYDSHEVQTSRTGYKGKQYFYLERFLVKRIDKMIMTTDTRAEYNAKLYSIEKPKVIHNYPIKREKIKTGLVDLYEVANIPREEPILLYQGGLQEGRGLEKIVQAIPKIKKGIIVFIGFGKMENQLKEMCEKTGIQERVRFIGKIPHTELLNYTENAYLGFQVLQNTCFNHYSTVSNKLLEYIMCGVPMIASNFPEIEKIVNESEVGLTIDPHSSDSISQAANKFIEDKALYNKFKENCKKARLIYNWENEENSFLEIYKRVGD